MDESTPEPIKRRGILPPYDPLQILSWLTFTLNLLIVSILYLRISPSVFFPILYYLTFSSVFSLTLFISIHDPTDPISTGKSPNPDPSITATCSICNTLVNPKSKHCGQCNRCVAYFDHHCKWLNTCIGKSNYFWFVLLICAVFVHFVVFFMFSLMVGVRSVYDGERVTAAFAFAFVAEAAVVLVLDFNLILLHGYLKYLGISTYEYIVRGRQRGRRVAEGNEGYDYEKTITGGTGVSFDAKMSK